MGRRGMTVRLRYVQRFIDRNGHERFYFRRAGMARAALPGSPGNPEFMAAYQEALNDGAASPRPTKAVAAPGSFDRLIAEYFKSPDFLRNRKSSQAVTRGILTRFAAKHGHRLVAEMQARHIIAIMGGMAETPAAANNLLKKLKVVLKFARKMGYRRDDPTGDIERYGEGTYHTWTYAELAQFEAKWPLGTRERTAYALAVFTGQRRADLVAMTWADYDARSQMIDVVQQKTGAKLVVPVHRDLRAALEKWPRNHLSILATPKGKGTSVAGFGNFMADAIAAAGLPERCVLHGLRKAAARRLAEAGCTAHQIQAITGHKSIVEVQRYTEAAEQRGSAVVAIRKLSTRKRKG